MKKQLVILAASLALAQFSNGAFAQQAASGAWGGWARCEITVQGPGYSDRQTHTWTITGGAPTVQGGFQIYAGTWAVVGGGSLSRTQGYQTLVGQWATNATETNAPLAVFVRASDNRMFIQARHSQLRTAAAVQGYQQVTISGTPQKPVNMTTAAFEWQFPVIAVTPPVAPNTNATATGSSSSPVNGSVGPMQPGGSRGTASCTWQFGQGSAAPPPPPPLTAQPVPTPGNPATVTLPPDNPPVTSTPPASSTSPTNPPLTATPLDPVLLPLPVFCTQRGPAQAAAANNYATPGAAHLDWEPVAGVTGYTVSRGHAHRPPDGRQRDQHHPDDAVITS